jgi:hypothetical protein
MQRLAIASLSVLLCACSGGDDSGQPGPAACASLNTGRSHIDRSCTGCGIANEGDVADGSLFSFADVMLNGSYAEASIRAGNGGAMLPAGTRAGAFYTSRVQLNSTVQGTAFGVRTYLQGALVEDSTGQVTIEDTQGGTDAELFASLVTTAPFDAVEFVMTYAGAEQVSTADIRVYEVCSDGHI